MQRDQDARGMEMLAASVIVGAINDISKRLESKITRSGRPHKQVRGYDSIMSDKHKINEMSVAFHSAVCFLFPVSRAQTTWTDGMFTLAGANLQRIQQYVWDTYPAVREVIDDSYHDRLDKTAADYECIRFSKLRRVSVNYGGAA